MKKLDTYKNKLKRISNIVLIVVLIFGVLSSAFGIGVAALGNKPSTSSSDALQTQNPDPENESANRFEAPTDNYDDLKNEAVLNDNVKVLTEEESQKINSSIISIENYERNYGDPYITVTLNGEDYDYLDDLSYGDIIYLQGDANTPLWGRPYFKNQ